MHTQWVLLCKKKNYGGILENRILMFTCILCFEMLYGFLCFVMHFKNTLEKFKVIFI
jgi:hypothetical protein